MESLKNEGSGINKKPNIMLGFLFCCLSKS